LAQTKTKEMKRLTLMIALAVGSVFSANANSYKLDEAQLEQNFAQATEVSFDQMFASGIELQGADYVAMAAESKTRGGFLVRAFFCGGIALHRYYMGTSRGGMWAMYFCIPVVGGVNACVDFWWSVFDGTAYQKYANNDKYIVWLD
jgi:hypothetical protein